VNQPPLPEVVSDGEQLARYVFFKSYVREDGTLRSNAFIPHPHKDISVTRHLGLDDKGIWQIGKAVAAQSDRPLHGRADLSAVDCRQSNLLVVSEPVEENPNHASIAGWPADKPNQKIRAAEIAAKATKLIPMPAETGEPA
jgi:hypothetical protein